MAFIMADAKPNQLKIFEVLFGATSPVVSQAAMLVSAGIQFPLGLYAVHAVNFPVAPANTVCALIVGTNTILKGLATPLQATACKKTLSNWINELFTLHPSTSKLATPAEKKAAEPLAPHFEVPVPKITDAVINLRDAKAVGQRVKGTSQGSVYHCVALNPRVKVATRVSGGSVSVRVECDNATKHEVDKLLGVGLSEKGGYYSLHLSTQESSATKVVGALLYGMCVKFDEVLLGGADLVLA